MVKYPKNVSMQMIFPLECDHDGNIWHLKSSADHLAHSKVLYHPTVIAKK